MINMTNSSTVTHSIKQVKLNKADEPLNQNEANKEIKLTELTPEQVKKQFNKAILQSNMEVNVSAGNDSLALLYKTAIEGINDVLKSEFGDNAIQAAADSDLDVTPKTTADRIVSMSTAFFSQYHQQHADMSEEEAAKSFAEIISGGIEKGFSEARDVLEGLRVLEGDIASNIDTTFDLVQEGLKVFVESYIAEKEDEL